MNFCIYRVYICLSANRNQMEIKIQKRKAEKNLNQKKKRKLTLSGSFPFLPLPFPALSPFGTDTRQHASARAFSSLFLADSRVPHVSVLFFLVFPLSSVVTELDSITLAPKQTPPRPSLHPIGPHHPAATSRPVLEVSFALNRSQFEKTRSSISKTESVKLGKLSRIKVGSGLLPPLYKPPNTHATFSPRNPIKVVVLANADEHLRRKPLIVDARAN